MTPTLQLPEPLREALATTLHNRAARLTPAELAVSAMMVQGVTIREVAAVFENTTARTAGELFESLAMKAAAIFRHRRNANRLEIQGDSYDPADFDASPAAVLAMLGMEETAEDDDDELIRLDRDGRPIIAGSGSDR